MPVGLTDPFFHLQARLEGDDGPFRHHDFLSGTGIACLSGLSLSDLEHTEVPKFDPPFLHQRFDNPIEDPLHDFLGLHLSNAHSLGNHLGHVFLGHDFPRQPPTVGTPAAFYQLTA